MDRYAFEPMDDEGRTMSFVAPPLRATDMVAYGSIEDLATTAGISEVSVHLCRMGSFGIWDLVDHMPTLRPLIAEHGERVIERCQLARFNCAPRRSLASAATRTGRPPAVC